MPGFIASTMSDLTVQCGEAISPFSVLLQNTLLERPRNPARQMNHSFPPPAVNGSAG